MGHSFNINLDLAGIQRQLSRIDKYDQDTQRNLRTSIRSSTEHIMVGAKRRVHIKTGKLVSKITMSYDERTNTGIVRARSPVAHLLEFGAKAATEKPVKKKALHGGRLEGFAARVNIPARKKYPFLTPAYEEEKPALIKNVLAAINHAPD